MAHHPHSPSDRARAIGDDPEPADLVYAKAGEPKGWLDSRRNVDLIVYALYALSVVLFAADFFVHKHAPFAIEHVFGFYAIYGFVGCVALVLIAKALRVLLMRPEDYYDR